MDSLTLLSKLLTIRAGNYCRSQSEYQYANLVAFSPPLKWGSFFFRVELNIYVICKIKIAQTCWLTYLLYIVTIYTYEVYPNYLGEELQSSRNVSILMLLSNVKSLSCIPLKMM